MMLFCGRNMAQNGQMADATSVTAVGVVLGVHPGISERPCGSNNDVPAELREAFEKLRDDAAEVVHLRERHFLRRNA